MQGIHGDANPRKYAVEMLTLLKRIRHWEADESRYMYGYR